MIERKYRLWDKQDKKMIYPEDVQDSRNLLAIGLHGLPIAVDQDSLRDGSVVGWNVDHRYVPLQSTGLKDKHGHEIYEMDIIHRPNVGVPMIVRWNEKNAGFDLAMRDPTDFDAVTLFYTQFAQDYEILGNIYEHPELVEVNKR